MKVLFIDDDVDLLDVATYALRREGFDVIAAADGAQGLLRWKSETPDVIVVDIDLPKQQGFELCRQVRHESSVPILLLTDIGNEADILRGLQLGADDYMAKPLSLKLLSARLRAMLRRCHRNPYEHAIGEVRAGDLVLNREKHEVLNRYGTVQLTTLEFKILYLLSMNEGRVVPYARLVDYAWGYEGGDASLLKTHISHVRKKLRLPESGPGSITALLGVGYSLAKTDVEEADASPAPRRTLRRRLAAVREPQFPLQSISANCGTSRRLPRRVAVGLAVSQTG